MQLQVLGRHGLYPPKGGACSGFYITLNDGRGILLDCGPGTLSKMDDGMLDALDTVVLTHLHWDHVSDALPLRYALERRGKNIVMIYPGDPSPVAAHMEASDRIETLRLSSELKIERDGFSLSFVTMRHPVPNYGVRVSADGALLAYSGDTNTCEGVARLLEGRPEIALLDACFSDDEWAEAKPHLSARLAAEALERARVAKPLLTHLPPDGDEALLLSQAKENCERVRWAEEGATVIAN